MKELPAIIAIDGPASSGKSTVGMRLARQLGYLFFDTGIMYRAATLAALQQLQGVDDEEAITRLTEKIQIDITPPTVSDGRMEDVYLDGVDVTWAIREAGVEGNVSKVSAYPGVRTELTAKQRKIGLRGNVVMVGRDIGTVVLPEAPLKIYLAASAQERARRRTKEILERGDAATYEDILDGIMRRDQIDSSRKVAPLRAAKDAVVVDTDQLGIEEVVAEVMKLVAERTA